MRDGDCIPPLSIRFHTLSESLRSLRLCVIFIPKTFQRSNATSTSRTPGRDLPTFKRALLPLEPLRYNPVFLQSPKETTERRWPKSSSTTPSPEKQNHSSRQPPAKRSEERR